MSLPITAIVALLIQAPAPTREVSSTTTPAPVHEATATTTPVPDATATPAPMHDTTATTAPRSAQPPPTSPPAEAATAPASSPTHDNGSRSDRSERSRRRLRVGGFVALGVGGGLVGVMASAAAFHVTNRERLATKEAALAPGEAITGFTRDQVQADLHRARLDRNLAIGAGVSAAVSFALAATLFTLGRQRGSSRRRLALAPMWLPSGAALHLQVRLP